MRKLLILLVVVSAIFLTSGCSGLVDSRQERSRRISQITNLQLKMLVDDWDYFWLLEQNASTTQWHPWVGI